MNKKGFTLIELIIVIAVISILAAAIVVAVDPARRLHETRNARRWIDVSTIQDAIKKHQSDNEGDFLPEIEALSGGPLYIIGTSTGSCAVTCGDTTADSSCVDLSDIGANYLAISPLDPQDGTEEMTMYAIQRYKGNRTLTIHACNAEGEGAGGSGDTPDIQVTRQFSVLISSIVIPEPPGTV